jgi:Zn-dependent M28 family amino/carboxypeptidase
MQDARGLRTCPVVNPAHAEKLFAGSGHTFEEVLAADAAGKPLPHFPLGAALRAKQTVKRWEVESPNVVAVSPGSDPTLAKEYVALSAHLDHLGIGEPIGGDRVYHGAMDNGSGVATMLEVARMLHDSGAHPKRSLLFVIVCGEEKGLLGSKYFAAHPTVDGKSIVADINVDMFLPLTPLKYLEVQGLGESSLGADVREVVRELGTGITVQADQQPDRNLFIRSDQYNFILHGIPSLAFKFSYLPDSPEAKQYKDWLTHNYHAPSDNAKQPVDLVGAAEFNQIILNLAVRVANDAARPRWEPNSFFRRFAGAGGN